MKRKVLSMMKFGYFFAASWVMLSMHAFAYIDPSAVTYIIQAVAAAFIAIGAVLTVFRHKIASFLKRGKKTSEKREIHIKEDMDEDAE